MILLVLSVGGVLALLQPRTRALATVAMATMVLVFSQVQYLRYFHPALVLWIPAVVAALLAPAPKSGWREGLLWGAVALQLALGATSGWMLMRGSLRMLATQGKDAVSDAFVPERALMARWSEQAQPTDRLLLPDPQRSFSAIAPGQTVGTAWFTPIMSGVRTSGPETDIATWDAVVRRAGSNHVLAYDLPAHPGLLKYLAARKAVRIDANGAAELFWLPPLWRVEAPATSGGDASPGGEKRTDRIAGTGGPIPALPVPPRLAVDRASAGEVAIAIGMPQPSVGQVAVELACDKPGQPIALAWSLPAAGSAIANHWEWVTCGSDHAAIAAVQFEAVANAGALSLTASAAKPESGMTVSIGSAAVDRRRDYHAQTALADWVTRWPCASNCAAQHSLLLPLQRGPILHEPTLP